MPIQGKHYLLQLVGSEQQLLNSSIMYFKLHFDNSIKAVLKWRNVHNACEMTLMT